MFENIINNISGSDKILELIPSDILKKIPDENKSKMTSKIIKELPSIIKDLTDGDGKISEETKSKILSIAKSFI